MTEPRPFEQRELRKAGFLGRLFGKVPRENALVQLTNRLASAKSVRDVGADDVARIDHQYGVDVRRRFAHELAGYYRAFLEFCLKDRLVSEEEAGDLRHLKALFDLPDRTVSDIHAETGKHIFESAVRGVLADGSVTAEERAFLDKLETMLMLPGDVASRIATGEFQAHINRVVSRIAADERLTPEEERELEALSGNLGTPVQMDATTRGVLDRYKLMWRIENGDLPTIDVPVKLQRNELAYFRSGAKWYEDRRVRVGGGGPGIGLSFRVARGVYLRSGTMRPAPRYEDVLTLIDEGDLYVTSKRLAFTGGRGGKTIRLSAILDFEPYSDGVKVMKSTGKPATIVFDRPAEWFGMMFDRLVREA